MEIALACRDAEDASEHGLNMSQWMFRIANALPRERERLVRLYTDPRVCPLPIQYLLGKEVWSKRMFSRIHDLLVAPERLDSVHQHLGVYLMLVHWNHLAYLYTGSATKSSNDNLPKGFRCRLLTHELTIRQGSEQVRVGWQDGSSSCLFAHVIASMPTAERVYLPLLSFHDMPGANIRRKTQFIVIQGEDMATFLLDTLRKEEETQKVTRTSQGSKFRKSSLLFMQASRPETGLPESPFRGLNIVLPMSQKVLLSKEGEMRLTDVESVANQEIVVLAAGVAYCEAHEPALVRLENGRYKLASHQAFDWHVLSHLAVERAPEGMQSANLTPALCKRVWSSTNSSWRLSRVYEQSNWDFLRGVLTHRYTISKLIYSIFD